MRRQLGALCPSFRGSVSDKLVGVVAAEGFADGCQSADDASARIKPEGFAAKFLDKRQSFFERYNACFSFF